MVSFQAEHIRPTTDRVKQTIFDKLMGEIEDSRVLDLFSGTGSLAIEALSRGALQAHSVEKNKKSIAILQQNRKQFELEATWKVTCADVFSFLKTYEGQPFELIFCDPPFTEKLAHPVMLALSTSHVIGKGTKVIIESAAREPIEDQYPAFLLLDRREFGDKRVSFFSAQ